jgi:uncharacterized protein (TIGR03067 family)
MSQMLAAFAVASLFIVPAAYQAEDAKKELESLQGAWEITEVVNSGRIIPAEKVKGGQIVIKGDELTLSEGADDKEPRKFSIKLDPSKKPRAIDQTTLNRGKKGMVIPAIYELDGETLKLCSPNDDSKDRPTALKSEKGSNVVLLTLKRIKK